MNNSQRLKYCVIANFILLILFISFLELFKTSESTYWKFGPNDKLTIISVPIDTWTKYWTLLFIIGLLKVSQVIIEEIATPILSFTIYNPDKKLIYDFTKKELQLYANSMYMINAIRDALMLMITISQVDIALYGAIISEITGVFTVKYLLDEKHFIKNGNLYNEV